MKERSDIRPYWHSADWSVNAALTMRKIYKRICRIDPNYKPLSRFQVRIRRKHAARHTKPGMVR